MKIFLLFVGLVILALGVLLGYFWGEYAEKVRRRRRRLLIMADYDTPEQIRNFLRRYE